MRIAISQAKPQAAQEPLFSFAAPPQEATFSCRPMVRMTAPLIYGKSSGKTPLPRSPQSVIKEDPTALLDSLISGPQ